LYPVKYVLFAVLIYFLYQFIFRLVIPVYQTTQKIKKSFRDINDNMNAQQESSKSTPEKKEKIGDYIDFEEVK
ncbi:MAG: hypothetical protein ACRDEB_00855, partial [Chitinophagaceae bacterium]